MTPDELKSIPKGEFVVMKTGSYPMRTRLHLFMDWGITFGEAYQVPEYGQRKVYYAGREELKRAIIQKFWTELEPEPDQTEKDRPPQRGRPGQRGNRHSRSDAPAGQSLVTSSNLPRKQETPPPASGGGDTVAYYDAIYEDQKLSHRAKAVYIYLKGHANRECTCWPGINTIASGVSLSRSTVKRALEDLVKAGLVEKSSRWRENGSLTSNLYRIK